MKLRNIIREKKGDTFQIMVMLILIFVIALFGLLTLVLTTRVNTFWDSSGLLNATAVGTQAIDKLQDTAPKTTDYAIFFLFLGMNIGIVVGAIRTNFSAAIIFLFILLTLVEIVIAAGLVNLYQGFAQQPTIIDVSSGLTFTNFIFSKYLPLLVSMISAFVMIIMYGKSGQEI
jgi:ammonia channel protein AmtB